MRYVAMFRGINVGKAKRIAMADLRTLLGRMGYTHVRTLLNSGNAVYEAASADTADMATAIRTEVSKKLKVDALVIVKSAADIAAVVKGNVLAAECTNPSRLLVAMANDPAHIRALKKYAARTWGDERVHVNTHAAYLLCAQGILESKAAETLLGELKDQGTTRNWATLNKIAALLSE